MFKGKIFETSLLISLLLIVFVLSIGLIAKWFLGTYTILIYGAVTIIILFILVIVIVAINLLYNAIYEQYFSSNVDNRIDNEIKNADRKSREDFKRFKKALNEITDSESLYYLPWFLLIGAPSSGKSKLLRSANLLTKFELRKEGQRGKDTQTKDYNIIITDKAVFIDIAGEYVDADSTEISQKKLDILLSNIVSHRPRCPINGVIFVLSAKDLMKGNSITKIEDDTAFIEQGNKYLNVLEEMTRTFKVSFPVFLVVTKLDLLKGFSELCAKENNLGQQMQAASAINSNQIVGYDILDNKNKGILPVDDEKFNIEFNSKFSRITEAFSKVSLIKKSPIQIYKDILVFPEYFKSIKNALSFYIKLLFTNKENHWKLRGCYFTSSLQNEQTEYSEALSEIDENLAKIIKGSTPYFTKKLVKEKIVGDHFLVTPIKEYHGKLIFYNRLTTVISILLISAMLCLFYFSGEKLISHITETFKDIAIISNELSSDTVLNRTKFKEYEQIIIDIEDSVDQKYWFSYWFITQAGIKKNLDQVHDAFRIKKLYRPLIHNSPPLNQLPLMNKSQKNQFVEDMHNYFDIIFFKKTLDNCDVNCDRNSNIIKVFTELNYYWKNETVEKLKSLENILSNMGNYYRGVLSDLESKKLNIELIKKFMEVKISKQQLKLLEPAYLLEIKKECTADYNQLTTNLPDDILKTVNYSCVDFINKSLEIGKLIKKNYGYLLYESDIKCISQIFTWLLEQKASSKKIISQRLKSANNKKEMVQICSELDKLPDSLPKDICTLPIKHESFEGEKLNKGINSYLIYQRKDIANEAFYNATIETWNKFNNVWRAKLTNKYPFKTYEGTGKADLHNRTITGNTHQHERLIEFYFDSETGFVLLNKINMFSEVARSCGVEYHISTSFNQFFKDCTQWKEFLYINKDNIRKHQLSVKLDYRCGFGKEGNSCYSEIEIGGHMKRYQDDTPFSIEWSINQESKFDIIGIDDQNKNMRYSLTFLPKKALDAFAFVYRWGRYSENDGLRVPFWLPFEKERCRVCIFFKWDTLPCFHNSQIRRGIIEWPVNPPVIKE